MNALRSLFAAIMIMILLVGSLIESTAHAMTSDCADEHCQMQSTDAVELLSHTDGGQSHANDHGSDTEHECCDQVLCQAVNLASLTDGIRPLDVEAQLWAQAGQLSALTDPGSLDRPPNI